MTTDIQYLLHESEIDYSNRKIRGKCEFSKFFKNKQKNLNKLMGRKISTKEFSEMIGIDYEHFRKIVNMQKKTKSRDCIIAICALLQVSEDDANDALKLYDMPPLNSEYPRDNLLLTILGRQIEDPRDIKNINLLLKQNHFPELDIINRRSSKNIKQAALPYIVMKKRAECRVNELLYGNQYDSLETMYHPERYVIHATMWIENNTGHEKYRLEATADKYYLFPFSSKGKFITYANIADTGQFYSYYADLKNMYLAELRKMTTVLADSKNYYERKSARVIDNTIHVFMETFNYNIPEFNEYYFMEYIKGKYIFSVSHESQFMEKYLSIEDYRKYYGVREIKIKEKYESIREINEAIANDRLNDESKKILKNRFYTYQRLKEKLSDFITSLKKGKEHIRNIGYIYSNDYEVLQFYNLENEFHCSRDIRFDEICKIGVDSIPYQFGNEEQITLSFQNILNGFELGLNTVDDIAVFLKNNKTLKIEDLL